MPRNQPQYLSRGESATQAVRALDLTNLKEKDNPVCVSYVKRDGTLSTSVGMVGEFSGAPGMDTGSVTIHTEDKGPRTINLHRITKITRMR